MSETVYIERYWRDAKPEDAIKEPPMVARFRQKDEGWVKCSLLYGYDRTREYRWSTKWSNSIGNKFPQCFKHCQVYDAPDPGEGYELIDPSLEKKRDGVEYLSMDGVWKPAGLCIEFQETLSYRRRITPTVTYVPFTWEDREQLRGRWVARDNQELQLVNLDNSDGFYANGVDAESLCKYWKFLDTGKPVGKEVAQ